MKKPIIAVDIDDVLADENGAMIDFINKNYGTKHSLEDYYNTDAPYNEFWESVWKVDKPEADLRYKYFQDWKNKNHLKPLPGATRVLKQLEKDYDIIIVTARNDQFLKLTKRWLDAHFPEVFSGLLFVALWQDGQASKAQISRKLGAAYLIDDNLDHCKLAAELGIECLLFGQYGWNRTSKLPKGVNRVKDWQEVLEYFDGRG